MTTSPRLRVRHVFGTALIGLFAVAGAQMLVAPGAARAQGASTVAAPRFELEPNFLKLPLPNGWTMGAIGSIDIDSRDHVWLLTRPRELPIDQRPKAAPPVIEFDQNGKFVQAWGGPSAGYEWPAREHALGVDPAGFVWIGGNAGEGSGAMKTPDDDVLLKFTTSGKFVKQFGRQNASKGNVDTANVKEPTVVRFFKKEAYVSDGYGNRRVIVFDAETMTFRRMWGAFGNVPKDGPQRDPAREAGWDPGPQQFGLPHALAVSRDGHVYVADRPNRRIQVFTTQGKYINQVVISGGRKPVVATDGTGSVTLSPDERFVYVGDPNAPDNKTVVVVDRKTMKIIDRFGHDQTRNPHEIDTDSHGNLYIASGTVLPRYVYKGTVQKGSTE
jgi:hypothetical protein